jgi:hypothetical protein
MNDAESLNTVNPSKAYAEALNMTNINSELLDEQLDNINGGAEGFSPIDLTKFGQFPKGIIPPGGAKNVDITVIRSSSTGNRR